MKIAVTCENNLVFQHFGRTPEFAIFEVEGEAIVSEERVPTNGTGHGALAAFLAERGVTLLFCGGIGSGAQNALAEANIEVKGGAMGNVRKVIEKYLNGTLLLNPVFQCHHHDNDPNHVCGPHGCGGHHDD